MGGEGEADPDAFDAFDAIGAAAPQAEPERPFFVGIGASAGGLEALSTLLPVLPAGLGLRYVVVQHLSPTHRSMLAELLGRTTTMEVLPIADGCTAQPDKIYITPPNCNVVLNPDATLGLRKPPAETVPKPSVNTFFTSLAETMKDRAIGIILSGTGSDGALGLHEIKAAGGFSFAQEPGDAKYDGMVRAAIEAGGVDWVLPAGLMGAEIARIVKRQQAADTREPIGAALESTTLQTLLRNLYAHTRIDFTGYKEPTLLRRIERRMTSTGCLTLPQYVEFARADTKELHTLAQDMLISVTSFFRDKAAFDRLREELIRLLEHKPAGEDIRVWVAGCASGEEAYSVAILLRDAMQASEATHRLQVFATDIDEAALTRARRGVFAESALAELDPPTLERHFKRHADGYEVSKGLREVVLFARHNLVQDPPFVRLDLVSCRNVLIYLQGTLQNRLMANFQYALKPGGLLFLGRSEGTHGNEGLFEPVDRGAHLFRRASGISRMPGKPAQEALSAAAAKPGANNLEDVLLRAVARRFAPAAVLVDAAGEVRQFSGDFTGIMNLPEGRPGFQLMGLVRRELRPELARLLRSVQGDAGGRVRPAMLLDGSAAPAVGRWRVNRALSSEYAVRMSAQALRKGLDAQLAMVCFERRPVSDVAPLATAASEDAAANSPSALEEQLAATREHLYTVIEELETTNEETQALNEEIQTANEEMQATNEELETSNEELQASNEELTTVNQELQVKGAEWQSLSTELESIYSSVDFPLLAFDLGLLLTRANPAAQRQLGIADSCLGRPSHLLPWPAGMPSLRDELEAVLRDGQTLDRQLLGVGSRHWAVRILPRLGSNGRCCGALVQMVDNTQLYESDAAAKRSHAQLGQLVQRSAQLVCICDPSGRLQLVNPEFERLHRIAPGSANGKLITDVLPASHAQSFRTGVLEAMRRLAPIEAEESVRHGDAQHHLLGSYYPLLDTDGAVSGVCYQALDITQRRQSEAELLAAQTAKLAAEGVARAKSSFLANMSHEIRTPMNAIIGLSRLALEDSMSNQARDHVGKAHHAAKALMGILDDVLDYSKIEAGKLRFEAQNVHLPELLQRVKDLFATIAEQKGLALSLELDPQLPAHIIVDPLRLSQVLNNLVGNAVKFTERGTVRIAARARAGTGARRVALRFSVHDTGIGIAPEVCATLFQPFTQADGTITRRFGGSGLGLAICARLVEMMGARINVSSEPGRGSEFWFDADFPAAPADDQAAQSGAADAVVTPAGSNEALARSERTPVALAVADAAAFFGSRVLLVEDNALNQIVGRAVLQQLGAEVTVVGDGQQAVDAIAGQAVGHFRAVLMDLHMPNMDGLEATRRIRALPQGEGLPMIAVTAAALSEDREQCFAAGLDDHVAKPLVPEKLLASMLSIAARRAAPGPATAATAPRPLRPREIGPIRGFDLQPLYERLRGDDRVVLTVLREFVSREAGTAEELALLLSSQRLETARHRAHELHNASATIGATLVARTSAALEAALGAGTFSPALLQSVQDALDVSLSSLRDAMQPHSA